MPNRTSDYLVSGFDLMCLIAGAFGIHASQTSGRFYEAALDRCLSRPATKFFVWQTEGHFLCCLAASPGTARRRLVEKGISPERLASEPEEWAEGDCLDIAISP